MCKTAILKLQSEHNEIESVNSRYYNYSQRQPFAYHIRIGIIEWLLIIHKRLGGQKQTFFKCIDLLEHYLSRVTTLLDRNDICLYSGICLFMSYKLEEVFYFDMEFLKAKIFGNKFTVDELIAGELVILKTLNFKTIYPCIINSTYDVFNCIGFERFQEHEDCIYYVNVITILIDDFRFCKDTIELSIISARSVLKVLEHQGKISSKDFNKFEKLITFKNDEVEMSYNLFLILIKNSYGANFKNIYSIY
jgi:hypothetical protein